MPGVLAALWAGQTALCVPRVAMRLLQVCELWQAKAAYEAAHGPCSLQAFLHQHFWHQAASSSTAQPLAQWATAAAPAEPPAAAASDGPSDSMGQPAQDAAADSSLPEPAAAGLVPAQQVAADGSSKSNSSGDSSSCTSSNPADGAAPVAGAGQENHGKPGGSAAAAASATAAAAAAAGYQLYYACCTQRQDSAAAELLWLVLTGQLPQGAMQEQQQQLQGLVTLLESLHKQATSPGPALVQAAAATLQDGTAAAPAAGQGEDQRSSSNSSAEASSSLSETASQGAFAWSCVMSALQVGGSLKCRWGYSIGQGWYVQHYVQSALSGYA